MKQAKQTDLVNFDAWSDVLRSYETLYVDCGARQFRVHPYADTLHVLDVTNAAKRGQECLGWSYNIDRNTAAVHNMLAAHGWNLERMYEAVRVEITAGGSPGYLREEHAIRTYSPFSKPLPLKAKPKKWTVELAVRAIINGQFESLRCKGVYTDDYAFDNAMGYQQGAIKDSEAFAARIMEAPGGWRTYEGSSGAISLCCHSFDCNEFVPRI